MWEPTDIFERESSIFRFRIGSVRPGQPFSDRFSPPLARICSGRGNEYSARTSVVAAATATTAATAAAAAAAAAPAAVWRKTGTERCSTRRRQFATLGEEGRLEKGDPTLEFGPVVGAV